MHKVPNLIEVYLNTIIFPETMPHQESKLSSSGQELGGDLLFGNRIGFSGTPNDLLPVELGKCHFEVGVDGKIMNVLTSAEYSSSKLLPKTGQSKAF